MKGKAVTKIMQNYVTRELAAIDRLDLEAYVATQQAGGTLVQFVRRQLGALEYTRRSAQCGYTKLRANLLCRGRAWDLKIGRLVVQGA